MKKNVLLSFVVLLFTTSLYSQGKYGADSAQCVRHLSFYSESLKHGNYEEATPEWHKAIAICPPSARQNLLLDGMKILRRQINMNKNNMIRKDALVDSLMMLHDMRLEYYPKYVVPAKLNRAVDMMTYMTSGQEAEVFEAMTEAMDVAKEKTSASIIVKSMAFANDMYNAGTMTSEQVMAAFNKSMSTANLVEASLKASGKSTKQIEKSKEDLENLLMMSGVANCENLVAMFTPRFEETPSDKDLLVNMVSMLNASGCMEEELFLRAVESLHKVEKTHASSYYLYQLYSNSNDMENAVLYLQEAIDAEDSSVEDDGKYLFELASYLFRTVGNDADAIAAAKKTAEISEEFKGKAYFLIGSIWGSQQCDGNDIEKRAPYWVAIDYLSRAKSADSTLAEEANDLIGRYKQYYPKQSDAFMFDVIEGATYTVSCNGLREVTKVRTQE